MTQLLIGVIFGCFILSSVQSMEHVKIKEPTINVEDLTTSADLDKAFKEIMEKESFDKNDVISFVNILKRTRELQLQLTAKQAANIPFRNIRATSRIDPNFELNIPMEGYRALFQKLLSVELDWNSEKNKIAVGFLLLNFINNYEEQLKKRQNLKIPDTAMEFFIKHVEFSNIPEGLNLNNNFITIFSNILSDEYFLNQFVQDKKIKVITTEETKKHIIETILDRQKQLSTKAWIIIQLWNQIPSLHSKFYNDSFLKAVTDYMKSDEDVESVNKSIFNELFQYSPYPYLRGLYLKTLDDVFKLFTNSQQFPVGNDKILTSMIPFLIEMINQSHQEGDQTYEQLVSTGQIQAMRREEFKKYFFTSLSFLCKYPNEIQNPLINILEINKENIHKYISNASINKTVLDYITKNLNAALTEPNISGMEKLGLGWLVDDMIKYIYSVPVALSDRTKEEFVKVSAGKQGIDLLNFKNDYLIGYIYKRGVEWFSNMIYSDTPKVEKILNPQQNLIGQGNPIYPVYKIVYNLSGYDNGKTDSINKNCTKLPCAMGSPIVLNEGIHKLQGKTFTFNNITPIGYNIFLPNKDIEGILVKVYGGFLASERIEKLHVPSQIGGLTPYLLSKGIAVIYLNLADFLELEGHQDLMTEDLHAKIHLSINEFFKTLKETPEKFLLNADQKLSEKFNQLKKKRIILSGGSFGGRTAVRHAELFPNTFDGYISVDGALAYATGVKGDLKTWSSDLKPSTRGTADIEIKAREWLSPLSESFTPESQGEGQMKKKENDLKIQNIAKPILLLHNFDDNNVNVMVSIKWYQAAIYNGKNSLVRFIVTRKGKPEGFYSTQEKGHQETQNKTDLANYYDTVTSFVLNGIQNLSFEQSQWNAEHYGLLAYANYRGASLEEKYMSLAYRLYLTLHKPSQPLSSQQRTHRTWDIFKGYKDVPHIYLSLYYLLNHLNELNSEKLGLEFNIVKRNLTGEKVKNALAFQLPLFSEFVKETELTALNKDEITKVFYDSPITPDIFKSLFENAPDDDFKKYLLQILYLSNPKWLEKIDSFYENDAAVNYRWGLAFDELLERIKRIENLEKQIGQG